MYLCLDCDRTFEEPHYYEETHGLDSPPYETLSECPRCGGNFVETYLCDCCGKWITGEYVKLSNGTVACEQCYEVNDIGD
jgi:DNA-directed RNA polymerase subunit RPC12/RpoP